jgi:hypothetical protein
MTKPDTTVDEYTAPLWLTLASGVKRTLTYLVNADDARRNHMPVTLPSFRCMTHSDYEEKYGRD